MSEIRISKRLLVGSVIGIAVILIALHLLNFAVVALGIRDKLSLVLSIDYEGGLFDTFSAGLLLVCSFLIGLIAAGGTYDKYTRWAWGGLAFIFFGLAADEGASMHDIAMEHLSHLFHLSGLLYAWVLPYGILLILLTLLYVRFIWTLPGDTRRRIIVAGIIYLSGAMGCDAVGGYWLHGVNDGVLFYVETTMEEVLEISGTIIFLYAFTEHLRTYLPDLRIQIG